MRYDHSFDWDGFYFVAILLVFVGIVLATSRFSVPYIYSALTSPSTFALEDAMKDPTLAAVALSSTTPRRVIDRLTIEDAIPSVGNFIGVDLVRMKLYLYRDGALMEEIPILSKGRPGTPWETPSGAYTIGTKEETHFSSIGHVYMPYSMQFFGNYFIHGWTYYPDGTPVSASFSGGCIKLSTEDARKVFAFASIGTPVFVYDSKGSENLPPLSLEGARPDVSSDAYLIADIDTGDVYAEKNASKERPAASLTKLMTALVANETISLDKTITLSRGALKNPSDPTDTATKTFLVNDLFYPLLMQSSDPVADRLAAYYGADLFVRWMNDKAHALSMQSTAYVDASGVSQENTSTPEDIYRLLHYLSNKKSFVLSITRTKEKTIVAQDGWQYAVASVNTPVDTEPFAGGNTGRTTPGEDVSASILTINTPTGERRIAVILLGSNNQAEDVGALASWITLSAKETSNQAACVACTLPSYRKIEL